MSVGHTAWLGKNRAWIDRKNSKHQNLIDVGFTNQVQFPKTGFMNSTPFIGLGSNYWKDRCKDIIKSLYKG